MILSEDYTLPYNLFLAEKALYSSLLEQSSIVIDNVLTEAEYIALCEGLQDSVINYMNKVTASIQEVWEKFSNTVGNDKQKSYLTEAAPRIKTANPRFIIHNFPNYDLNVFRNYKVNRYNRETMEDELKTQKAYYQKYYSSLYSERNNMNVMMQRNVVQGYTDIRCDKNTLTRCYNFCSTGFYEAKKSIEQDIAVINEAVANITQSLQMVKMTQESNMFYEGIIIEALTNGQPENKAQKMSFTDSDGTKSEPGDKSAQIQNSFINQVANYMKVSTSLISAKMKVLTQMYKSNLDIVKHFLDVTQYGEPVPNNQPQKVVTQTVTQQQS